MRIMITGGLGLVGRNISERLASENNIEVLSPPREELDLLDASAVTSFLKRLAPDIVIHCAGVVGGIQANIQEPVRFFVENLEVGKNVVLSSYKAGVKRLLNLGSSCMYPRGAPNPLREEFILNGELEPTNEGYALAKIAVQRLCVYLSKEHPELLYKTAVPCNLYGKWDKFDPTKAHMIPAVIRKLHEAKHEEKNTVDIWGSGQARREFMYVGDLADFIAYAINKFEAMPNLLNVGLGRDYTIDEYYEVIARVVGYKGEFAHDSNKPEGMAQKLVDISRLDDFGWAASTSLEEGVRLTYQFFLEKENC